jgi:hypothetical protein
MAQAKTSSLRQRACFPDKLTRRWRSAPIDTLSELRRLADDLSALGGDATEAFVRQAIDRFSARKFTAGEELLERALEERRLYEQEPPRSRFFNTCALVVA